MSRHPTPTAWSAAEVEMAVERSSGVSSLFSLSSGPAGTLQTSAGSKPPISPRHVHPPFHDTSALFLEELPGPGRVGSENVRVRAASGTTAVVS